MSPRARREHSRAVRPHAQGRRCTTAVAHAHTRHVRTAHTPRTALRGPEPRLTVLLAAGSREVLRRFGLPWGSGVIPERLFTSFEEWSPMLRARFKPAIILLTITAPACTEDVEGPGDPTVAVAEAPLESTAIIPSTGALVGIGRVYDGASSVRRRSSAPTPSSRRLTASSTTPMVAPRSTSETTRGSSRATSSSTRWPTSSRTAGTGTTTRSCASTSRSSTTPT